MGVDSPSRWSAWSSSLVRKIPYYPLTSSSHFHLRHLLLRAVKSSPRRAFFFLPSLEYPCVPDKLGVSLPYLLLVHLFVRVYSPPSPPLASILPPFYSVLLIQYPHPRQLIVLLNIVSHWSLDSHLDFSMVAHVCRSSSSPSYQAPSQLMGPARSLFFFGSWGSTTRRLCASRSLREFSLSVGSVEGIVTPTYLGRWVCLCGWEEVDWLSKWGRSSIYC